MRNILLVASIAISATPTSAWTQEVLGGYKTYGHCKKVLADMAVATSNTDLNGNTEAPGRQDIELWFRCAKIDGLWYIFPYGG